MFPFGRVLLLVLKEWLRERKVWGTVVRKLPGGPPGNSRATVPHTFRSPGGHLVEYWLYVVLDNPPTSTSELVGGVTQTGV